MGISERKDREKQEMRGLILSTAMALFLEEGFDKVTIRRIAGKIEYSPATIYLYFRDKAEILFALHDEGFEKLYKEQQTILSVEDPWERLRKHAGVYLSFALGNPEYYQLMFIMKGITKELKEVERDEKCFRSFEFLKADIRNCMEAGFLPEADAEMASFAFWSFIHGIASLIICERVLMVPEDQLPSLVEQAIDFVMDSMNMRG